MASRVLVEQGLRSTEKSPQRLDEKQTQTELVLGRGDSGEGRHANRGHPALEDSSCLL